jgi:hypothetical protein
LNLNVLPTPMKSINTVHGESLYQLVLMKPKIKDAKGISKVNGKKGYIGPKELHSRDYIDFNDR